MHRLGPTLAIIALVLASLAARADDPPDITKDTFTEIATFLQLTPEQAEDVRPKVARIQEIFRMADRQRPEGTGRPPGGRGIGGFGGFGGSGRPPQRSGDDADRPSREELRQERQQWEVELKSLHASSS